MTNKPARRPVVNSRESPTLFQRSFAEIFINQIIRLASPVLSLVGCGLFIAAGGPVGFTLATFFGLVSLWLFFMPGM